MPTAHVKPPNQAPAVPVSMIMQFVRIAAEPRAPAPRRIFATTTNFLSTKPQFVNLKRIDSLSVNETAMHGTTWRTKDVPFRRGVERLSCTAHSPPGADERFHEAFRK